MNELGTMLLAIDNLSSPLVLAMQLLLLAGLAQLLISILCHNQPEWINRIWLTTAALMLVLPFFHCWGGWPIQIVTQVASREIAAQQRQSRLNPNLESSNASESALRTDTKIISAVDLNSDRLSSNITTAPLTVRVDDSGTTSASKNTSLPVDLSTVTALSARSSRYVDRSWQLPVIGYVAVCLLLLSKSLIGSWRLATIVRSSQETRDEMFLRMTGEVASRMNLSAMPEFRFTDEVTMPLACGWHRPLVLLPQDFLSWPQAEQQAVILHELAHVQRGDLRAMLTARVLQIVYWVHPAAWWTARGLRQSLELCADLKVLEHGNEPAHYASILLNVVQRIGDDRTSNSLPGVAMSAYGRLEERLSSILRGANRKPLRSGPWLVVLLIGLASATTIQLQGVLAETMPNRIQPVVADENKTVTPEPSHNTPADGHDLIARLLECEVLTVEGDEHGPVFDIDGQVFSADGRPVAGATVVLRESSVERSSAMIVEDPTLMQLDWASRPRVRDVFARTTTDQEGRYRFENAMSPATSPFWQGAWRGSIVAAHPEVGIGWKVLNSGKEGERVALRRTIVLQPTSSIGGNYQTPDGHQIGGAPVCVFSVEEAAGFGDLFSPNTLELSWSQLMPISVTNADGEFRVSGLPTGRAALVSAVASGESAGSMAAIATSPEVPLVERKRHFFPWLRALHASPMTIIGEAGFQLHGRVQAEDGTPVPDAVVTPGLAHCCATDADGKFEIRLPQYLADDLFRNGNELMLRVRPNEETNWLRQKVKFTRDDSSANNSELTITLQPGTRVSGTIVDDAGKPIDQCGVLQWKNNGEFLYGAATNTEGRYEIVLPLETSKLLFMSSQPGFGLPSEPEALSAKPEQVAKWLTRSVTVNDLQPIELGPVVVSRIEQPK